ncbi:MAG: fibronectin type III domain-containing protein [candidate division WOR-3 bacterium]
MKRLLSIAGVLSLVILAIIFVRCPGITGGEPTNLRVVADTDSTVKLTWTAPTEGTPDKYIVYFKDVSAASYTMVANNVTTTEYIHDPNGATGTYQVAAMFGSEEYKSSSTVSTVPIATSAKTVAELNASGNSGYGWNRSDGSGTTYSMDEVANAPNVDFYITDFQTSPVVYSIASPNLAPNDQPQIVEQGPWRVNGIAVVTSETAPLPTHNTTIYHNYEEITATPFFAAVYTNADGYYALVKLDGFNPQNKTYEASTWFQLVKGLRLIKH